MKKEPFEELDKSLMEKLKDQRERKVPWEILRGFSASVEQRISATKPRRIRPHGVRSFVDGFADAVWRTRQAPQPRVWIPVLAVMVLAFFAVIHLPGGVIPTPGVAMEPAQGNGSELATEIAALRDLGVWTEDDEAELSESDLEELEELA